MPSEIVALHSLSLEIPRGQFVTIIGSNGAGKTTLVSVIAGSVIPVAGQIRLQGRNVSDTLEYERSRYVARVFQDPQVGTCANFSIEENLAMAERRGQPRGLSLAVTQKSRSRYRGFLRRFGLGFESRLTEKVGSLSGGQRQALALLMAIMRAPDILLLDEHTAALDPKNRAMLQELTERVVREQGCTTIMVTHNMDTAIRYGDRMIMLHRGSVLFDVQGHTKQSLTVERLISSFHAADDAVFTDELLFT